VITSDPKSRAAPDSVVKLIVSDGPAPVKVPDALAGKSYEDAAGVVTAARLQPVRRDDFNDTVPAGQVIGTEPAGGAEVPRDSQVTIAVSKGPDLVAVPRVAGRSIEDASAALAVAGLQVYVQGNYAPGRSVVASDPGPGTMVHRGATVRVFL
jgi:serine/threonine-protein kinase